MHERPSAGGYVWRLQDGQIGTDINGRFYPQSDLPQLDRDLQAKYRSLKRSKVLSPNTHQVLHVAEAETASYNIRRIGSAEILLGVLAAPRTEGTLLTRFFEEYFPGTQEEQLQVAHDYLNDLRKDHETEERAKGPFHISVDTQHVFRIATAEAKGQRRKVEPLDLIVGIAPVMHATGPTMLMDMMKKDNVYYPALVQANWYSGTEEGVTIHVKRMLAGLNGDQNETPSEEQTRRFATWDEAHDVLRVARASGNEYNWPFEQSARLIGIPREDWDLPLVRRYVDIFNRALQLQIDLWDLGHDLGHMKLHQATGSLPGALAESFDHTRFLAEVMERTLIEGFQRNSWRVTKDQPKGFYPQIQA